MLQWNQLTLAEYWVFLPWLASRDTGEWRHFDSFVGWILRFLPKSRDSVSLCYWNCTVMFWIFMLLELVFFSGIFSFHFALFIIYCAQFFSNFPFTLLCFRSCVFSSFNLPATLINMISGWYIWVNSAVLTFRTSKETTLSSSKRKTCQTPSSANKTVRENQL